MEDAVAAPTATSGGDSPARAISLDSLDRARFLPGTMLAGRYRIIGLLGRGGMGEVYRADDLKLGQPVALKFLPPGFEGDSGRLTRLLNEVRLARQVSHPNVCRVYDVGEMDGHHFLSMEFVDGEDLGSLLRQIGRFPRDKAAQIARQLCAGLAAAHEQGILHRDLKPANVMIDGRGRVRITDFGLASFAETLEGDEARSGTPGYMAPEQLAGRSVTVRSDIYSLGLVLYELFTGRRAWKADTPAELRRLQESGTPSSPSSHVEGLQPAVERVILRCLERDPAGRPASALAVAAALPGGDPLAAALAAGETPSPEMVAEAGEAGGLKPWIGAACVAAVAAGILLAIFAGSRQRLVLIAPPELPPAALAVMARQIVVEAGYPEEPADSAFQLAGDEDQLRHIEQSDSSATRWDALASSKPAPVQFWYRQSPRSLLDLSGIGEVNYENPPHTVTGMVSLRLDASGRLLEFLAVPPQLDASAGPAPEIDWRPLLRRAGLDPDSLAPAQPAWSPLVDCDERQAWEGAYAGQPDVPIRLEAGSYRGLPVYLAVVPPWRKPWRQEVEPWERGEKAVAIILTVLLVILVGGAALLARRNLRLGRADRRGAFRLAAVIFVIEICRAALYLEHVAEFREIGVVFVNAAVILLISCLVWLVFIALEPYVRRLWPEALISWNRLLAGRLRDPRIGRDILIGGVAWAGLAALQPLRHLVDRWMGVAPGVPNLWDLFSLSSAGMRAASLLIHPINSLVLPILMLFFLLLLRVILRRQWAAVGVLMVAVIAIATMESESPQIVWVFVALGVGVHLYVLIRFGLLASVALFLFGTMSGNLPLLSQFPAWYAKPFVPELLLIAGLAGYGFVISLAGRPLFSEDALELREPVRVR